MDDKLIERVAEMSSSKDKELHNLGWGLFFSNDPTSEDYVKVIIKIGLDSELFSKKYFEDNKNTWIERYSFKNEENRISNK